LKEKNTDEKKQEEASSSRRDKSFKFINYYFSDINILCRKIN
jgi:hypothetical protein